MPFLAPLIGAAGAAIGGVSGLLGSTALGGALGGLLVKTALSVGLSVLSSVFAPTQATQPSGVELEAKYGDENPRTVALGTVAAKGQFIYADSYGPSNRHAAYVFKLADWRTSGIRRVMFEGAWYDLDTTATSRGFRVLGVDAEIYVRYYDGTQQTANNELVNNAESADRWDENSIMTGCSYVIVTGTYDQEHLPTMGDILLFEYDGAPLYDPRKDSTRGGSGTHRVDDPDTWEFSSNPALMMLGLELGFYNNGELMAGKGMPINRMPLAKWALAASICDEIVDSEARYEASLIAQSGEGSSHLDNLEPLLRACAGAYYHAAEGPSVYVGANRTPVATLTDDDLLYDEDFSLSLKQSRSNLVNYLSGTYIDPEKFWETVSYEPRLDSVAFAQDRERLSKALPFTAVSRRTQAERLRDIYQRANRYQKTGNITTRLRWLVLEPGDWIEYQSERYPAFSGTYEVKTTGIRSLSAEKNPLAVTLDLDEVGDGIFDPTQYSLEQPIVLPRGRIVTNALQGFDATPTFVTSDGEGTYPAFRLTWNAIDDETISRVQVQYWPTSQPNSRVTVNVEPDQVDVLVQENVVPNTEYTFRHRLISVPKRNIPWVDGGTATSGAAVIDGVSDILAQALEDVQPRLEDINARADEFFNRLQLEAANSMKTEVGNRQRLVEFRETFGEAEARFSEDIRLGAAATEAVAQKTVEIETSIDQNNTLIADQITALTNADQSRAETIRILQANFDFNSALVAAELEALVDADQSQINALSLLRSDFDQNSATVATQLQTLVDADSAFAELVSGLQTATANATADGLVRYEAESDPSGAQARISQLVRASSGDNYVDAADITEVIATPDGTKSRKILKMKELIVLNDDGSESAALTVINGKTTMNIARANSFVMDEDISSSSGKVRFGTLGVGKEGLAVYD